MTDSLREHLARIGKSRSEKKLLALAENRKKAIEKSKREGRSPAQIEALAKAREALRQRRLAEPDRC